jgi:RimK-like ATP-grasp domain
VILLWGLEADSPMALVGAALAEAGAPLFFLDQRRVAETRLELLPGEGVAGRLSDGCREIRLEDVSAIYLRPFDTRRIAAVERAGPGTKTWTAAVATDDALLCWCEMTPAVVVNRPAAMASNNSKPYQSSLIAASGFRVPDTLVTTDAGALEEFWSRHGEVVYKSVSGVRSIVARLTDAHRERLPLLTTCPTQFQQYIPGVDVRVHIVGDEAFAAKICSEADDYRYAARQDLTVSIAPISVPDKIASRCRDLCAALGLLVAGIDLRRTPDGEWYCFEVNPSPGFSFYEHATGQPIAAALAQLLMS